MLSTLTQESFTSPSQCHLGRAASPPFTTDIELARYMCYYLRNAQSFLLVTCISVVLSVLSCVADCHCLPIVLIAAVCQHEFKCIIICPIAIA